MPRTRPDRQPLLREATPPARRRSGAVLLALLAVVSVPAYAPRLVRDAEAGPISKRYRDRNAKFSFRVWDDWDPVPLETEGKSAAMWGSNDPDRWAVCKYVERGADKRGAMAAELKAYRIGGGMVGMRTGVTTPSDEKKDPFADEVRKRLGEEEPKEALDLFLSILTGSGYLDEPEPERPTRPTKPKKGEEAAPPAPRGPEDWEAERQKARALGLSLLSDKAAKAIKSRDGVPGKMWVLERKSPRAYWTQKPFYMVFASFKKEEVEVGLWLVCEGERKKKLEQDFKTVVSSFTWFDDQADDVEAKKVLDGVALSAEKRRAIERGLVDTWDVVVSSKKNYVILYNTKGRRNDLLARIIAERIEQIREQIYEVQFPPAKPITTVCIARVCGDRAEYHAYGGPGGSAGYWNSDTEELVFYDASPKKEADDDTMAVLYHEAFHQYIYYSVGEVSPHSWFNEGHGDYYAGAKYGSGKKFHVKPFNWRVGTIQAALLAGPSPYEEVEDPRAGRKVAKYDRSKGGYTPLHKFVRMTQGEYYSYPGVSYAQGWSLIYFLREYVPKNPKWAAKWGKILPTYFDTLKAEVNSEAPRPKPDAKPPSGGDAPPPPEPPPGGPAPDDGGPPADPPGGDEPPKPPTPPGGDDDDGGLEGGFVMPSGRFRSSAEALNKAVDAAFAGVDFAELEAAWRDTMKKVK